MSRFIPLALLALISAGCGRPAPQVVVQPEPAPVVVAPAPPDDGSIPPPREVKVRSRIDSLMAGVGYLQTHQSDDGAWRSDVYATFRDGTALTPLVVVALQEASDTGILGQLINDGIKNGCDFLSALAKDGSVAPPADGFDYPLYTAALTLKAFCHPTAKDYAKHREAWVKYIKERQLTEKLGWKPDEKQYGGWGYCRVIPKKPKEGEFAPPLIESNLSATLFALYALKAAGELDEETAKKAMAFVFRCQNWRLPVPGVPPPWFKHIDGGFHFIYDDPTRNKAGMVPKEDEHWPQLFYSYGSTTTDGFRALHLYDLREPKDLPELPFRRAAAGEWLTKNFRADKHPGTYVKAHEPNRDAVYYYYAASVSQAFRDHKLELPNGRDWRAELSYELALRQAKDGSWTNPIELVRENDPIVATSNAVLAIARCGK